MITAIVLLMGNLNAHANRMCVPHEHARTCTRTRTRILHVHSNLMTRIFMYLSYHYNQNWNLVIARLCTSWVCMKHALGWFLGLLFLCLSACLFVRPPLSRVQNYVITLLCHCMYSRAQWKFAGWIGQSTSSWLSFVLPRWRRSGKWL